MTMTTALRLARPILLLAASLRVSGLTPTFPLHTQATRLALSSKGCSAISNKLVSTTTTLSMAVDPTRENEIRRKIIQLKKAGKIKKASLNDKDESSSVSSGDLTLDKIKQQRQRLRQSKATNDYSDQIKDKLGKKTKWFGDDDEDDDVSGRIASGSSSRRPGQLGSLPKRDGDTTNDHDDDAAYKRPVSSFESTEFNVLDPSLFQDDDSDDENEDEPSLSDEELVELVAKKLQQKKDRKRADEERHLMEKAQGSNQASLSVSSGRLKKTTSGVGGSWAEDQGKNVETYKPKTGSWGAFERPKDISKAYGGGRRVGAGIDRTAMLKSAEDTRKRLREYREKVGIEVQSEKDNAQEIDRALAVAGYAMQRGMYSQAVATLEKVTKWCSTNSKVGGKVFLELAMAYEAEGRTQEAMTVYTTLTKCRIEEIKQNAKRLLYSIEAMQFMRNEARSSEFSRKKIRNTFIDTTGLARIAENFDDVYQTAYIDLDGGYYRRLTESVVRGNREARQILLQATGSGEVERLKIVQALRSLTRHFDDALSEELKRAAPTKESVAIMDGRPIVPMEPESVESIAVGMDEFHLSSASDMIENLNGEWRLQLLADKRGDGVKYFNTTLAWQFVDTDSMSFQSSGPAGFLKVSQSGDLEFERDRRVLIRRDVETKGGMLSGLFMGGNKVGQAAPQQIVSVDSVLLITRASTSRKRSRRSIAPRDEIKEHFAVWRRVDEGTYSDQL